MCAFTGVENFPFDVLGCGFEMGGWSQSGSGHIHIHVHMHGHIYVHMHTCVHTQTRAPLACVHLAFTGLVMFSLSDPSGLFVNYSLMGTGYDFHVRKTHDYILPQHMHTYARTHTHTHTLPAN